ncbi:MmpS family transport accessory protein [Micromonospora sp. NPDC049366]|uniref:MmpS family transport accessory protein n=1 Tax=Micromonospora sp. NPDC049366 TaxID=3364271 RepID=UPI003796028F
MPEGTGSPEPSPWAPLDPPSTRRAAPTDRWLPTDGATGALGEQPTGPAGDGAAGSGPRPGRDGPSGGPRSPAGRRPSRRVRAGVAVAAVLLLGAAGFGGYAASGDEPSPDASPEVDSWYADETDPRSPDPPAPSRAATPASTPSTGPGRDSVVYEATGQGRADVLYVDANGEPVWLDGVRLPWRTRIRTDHADRLMVQVNRTDDSGPVIACSLRVNAARPVTEEATSIGWRASCFG